MAMTTTTAILVNVVLMAGIAAALAAVIRIPFKLPRPRVLAQSQRVAPEHELSRAA
jgi:hypothetical protein